MTDTHATESEPTGLVLDPDAPIITGTLTGQRLALPELSSLNLSFPAALDSLEALRAAVPAVKALLIDRLRAEATAAREARGTVVVPEDTFDLVRRLTATGEVLRQWRDAFEAAAKETEAITEEEALAVAGAELDGVLTSSLFVPDGEGQRIAVRADYKPGESTWDVATLVAWLVEDTVKDTVSVIQGPTSREELPDLLATCAREVVDRVLSYGRFSPGAKLIEGLRRKLAERGRDDDAATIRQVRSVGPRTYLGVKVTREESPRG